MNNPNSNGPELEPGAVKKSVADNSDSTLRIGHSIDQLLEDFLWRLIAGDLELSAFSPAFKLWWSIAADQGRESRQAEIDRLTYERDLWYACYANGWTPAEYMRRHTDALWNQAVAA